MNWSMLGTIIWRPISMKIGRDMAKTDHLLLYSCITKQYLPVNAIGFFISLC